MEATSHVREYSVSWLLTLEFAGSAEQEYWDSPYFRALIKKVVESERQWDDRTGQSTLVVADPTLRRGFHPDYGPETTVQFEHRGLTLSQKQLWAYETWAQKMAAVISSKLSESLESVGLQKQVIWDIRVNLSTPLRNPEREYRVASKPGDIVRMSCGTLAVITDCDIIMAGHVKQVTLRPVCGVLRHLWLKLRRELQLEEDGINRLTKIGEVSLA